MVTAVTYAFSQAIIFFAYIITFRFGAFLITLDDSHVLYVEFQDVYRVFAAIIFGALAIGAAGSFAPDYTKAKLAAKQVFAILDRRSQIDSYSPEGNRPVSVFTSSLVLGLSCRQHCCPLIPFVPLPIVRAT